MTLKGRPRLGLAACAVLLFACDRGSVGAYASDDGGASSGATSGIDSTTSETGASMSGVSMTSVGTTGEAGSEASTDTSGEESTGSTAGACQDRPNHQCAVAADCGDSCGQLESMFDEAGCARRPCSVHSDCGAGAFCYRASYYGGCQSSDVGCVDDGAGGCLCASLPDCGGAYCVPEEIVFAGASAGPVEAWTGDDCGPADEQRTVVRVGTAALTDDVPGCGPTSLEDTQPIIEFIIDTPFEDSNGLFTTNGPVDVRGSYAENGVDFEPVQWVVLNLAMVFEGPADMTGTYEVRLQDDSVLYGEFFGLSCPTTPECG